MLINHFDTWLDLASRLFASVGASPTELFLTSQVTSTGVISITFAPVDSPMKLTVTYPDDL